MKNAHSLPMLLSIGIGVFWFVSFAITRPIFGNLLYDVSVYLGLGVAAILLFCCILFGALTLLGRSRLTRGETIRPLGGVVIAAALVSSAAITMIAADGLAKVFSAS